MCGSTMQIAYRAQTWSARLIGIATFFPHVCTPMLPLKVRYRVIVVLRRTRESPPQKHYDERYDDERQRLHVTSVAQFGTDDRAFIVRRRMHWVKLVRNSIARSQPTELDRRGMSGCTISSRMRFTTPRFDDDWISGDREAATTGS